MVFMNFKKVLIIIGFLCAITNCVARITSQSLIENNDESIHLSSSSSNMNKIDNVLLSENSKEHFSFIQEEESNIGTSYIALIEKLSQSPSIRNLQDSVHSGNNAVNSVSYTRSMNDDQMRISMYRNIMIWLPITLVILLYFVIMSLVDMPIQKNSILYAKYGTTKQMQAAQ